VVVILNSSATGFKIFVNVFILYTQYTSMYDGMCACRFTGTLLKTFITLFIIILKWCFCPQVFSRPSSVGRRRKRLSWALELISCWNFYVVIIYQKCIHKLTFNTHPSYKISFNNTNNNNRSYIIIINLICGFG